MATRTEAVRRRQQTRGVSCALWLGWLVALGAAGTVSAWADEPLAVAPGGDQAAPGKPAGKPPGKPSGKADEPDVLSADKVTYDEALGLMTASGRVELLTRDRAVYADAVSYNQKTKVLVASGHVRMFEAKGEVSFGDYAELTDDFANVFVERVRILTSDRSRMAGNEAERRGGRMTRISQGVYSPCDLCAADSSLPPLWQLRATRIVHDNDEHEVRYADATMDMFGVPVFYTPFFSHPDPTVKRHSGFLTPSIGHGTDVGSFLRNGYYFDIAPDLDATAYLSLFSSQMPVVGGEVRKRFDNGRLQIEGTFTQSDFTHTETTTTLDVEPRAMRGYVKASGLFDLSDAWRIGGNLDAASDRTFLYQYYGFRENFLTSRAFAEGFYGRDYIGINAYRFQDLRVGVTEHEPTVFPLAQYQMFGEPGEALGGRWSMDLGLLGLERSRGTDYTRMSMVPGWQRQFHTDLGLVATVATSVRTDVYNYRDYTRTDLTGSPVTNGSKARFLPEADITVRYPWARQGEDTYQVIEPVVALMAAPDYHSDARLPNEDSQDVEFNVTNLFRLNRYPGYDRIEGGQRLTYGMRAGVYGVDSGRASLFLGESYRLGGTSPFAVGTGLETTRSDYVGWAELAPATWLNTYYGFRLRESDLKPRQQSWGIQAGVPWLTISADYNALDSFYDSNGTLNSPQELATLGIYSSVTRYWSVGLQRSQRFSPDPGPVSTSLTATYSDDCLTMQAIGLHEYSDVPGVSNGTTLYFRFVFRNLGEITSPSLSSSMISSGTSTSSR